MKKFSTYSRLDILDPSSRPKSLLRQIHFADFLIHKKQLQKLQEQINKLEVQIGKAIIIKR